MPVNSQSWLLNGCDLYINTFFTHFSAQSHVNHAPVLQTAPHMQ